MVNGKQLGKKLMIVKFIAELDSKVIYITFDFFSIFLILKQLKESMFQFSSSFL
jgi:hypothetical protein